MTKSEPNLLKDLLAICLVAVSTFAGWVWSSTLPNGYMMGEQGALLGFLIGLIIVMAAYLASARS